VDIRRRRAAGGAAVHQPATACLLARVGPGGDVLDAACGAGIDAAVLARRGFNVQAADGSQAMVEVAARFRREGPAIAAGGHLVIDSRNWEKLHAERCVVHVMNGVRIRGGRR
jgi:SAM-dependent methyltransferase